MHPANRRRTIGGERRTRVANRAGGLNERETVERASTANQRCLRCSNLRRASGVRSIGSGKWPRSGLRVASRDTHREKKPISNRPKGGEPIHKVVTEKSLAVRKYDGASLKDDADRPDATGKIVLAPREWESGEGTKVDEERKALISLNPLKSGKSAITSPGTRHRCGSAAKPCTVFQKRRDC